MKKYLFLSLAIAAILFTSCKKDEEEETPSTYLKMKIDNGDEISFTAQVTVVANFVNITGQVSTEKMISIQFPKDATGDVSNPSISYTENNQQVITSLNIDDISLNISENNSDHVAGSFTIDYHDDNGGNHTATGSFDLDY